MLLFAMTVVDLISLNFISYHSTQTVEIFPNSTVVWHVLKIAKSDGFLICLVCLAAWKNLARTGRIFMKFYI